MAKTKKSIKGEAASPMSRGYPKPKWVNAGASTKPNSKTTKGSKKL